MLRNNHNSRQMTIRSSHIALLPVFQEEEKAERTDSLKLMCVGPQPAEDKFDLMMSYILRKTLKETIDNDVFYFSVRMNTGILVDIEVLNC